MIAHHLNEYFSIVDCTKIHKWNQNIFIVKDLRTDVPIKVFETARLFETLAVQNFCL